MASDQIRQMVNFILQEAHEKANEIRVKVSFVFLWWHFLGGGLHMLCYFVCVEHTVVVGTRQR